MGEIIIKIINGVGPGPSEEVIGFTEDNLGVSFPENFLSCIKICEEGRPEKHIFSFKNKLGNQEKSCLGAFLGFDPQNKYNILRKYLLYFCPFQPHLVPFAEVGNGDYICFDYSVSGFDDKNPPVVYFDHEQPNGENISDIAINFEEFLNKLEPEEETDF